MKFSTWPVLVGLLLATQACDGQKQAASSGKSAAAAVAVGEKAPDVSLTLHDGKTLKLSSLAGHSVLLYFYPKDDTPG